MPPPPDYLVTCLRAFEGYLHTKDKLPRLVQIAMAHYQFEAIHPFNDGNGRIGRLLVTLQLCERAQLSKPLVYVSAFFAKHQDDYKRLLRAVSLEGAWEEWIEFFLLAIETQALDARRRAEQLLSLQAEYHDRVTTPRASALLPKMVDYLFERPAVTVKDMENLTAVTNAAAGNNLARLEEFGIVERLQDQTWRQVWIAPGILAAIDMEFGE